MSSDITLLSLLVIAADIILKSVFSREMGLQPFTESAGLPVFGISVTMPSLNVLIKQPFDTPSLKTLSRNTPICDQKCLKNAAVNPLLPGDFPFFIDISADVNSRRDNGSSSDCFCKSLSLRVMLF